MKLRKRKLFSSIAFMLSLVMLAVSGAVFIHSATQQSATSSLSVTFSGENVNYEVQGWYHIHGGSRTELVDNDLDNDNIVTFFATEPPTEKTLKISNTEVNNKAVLTSEHPYVLFTYKFTNTASEGAFGMEVSLNMSSITNSNLKAVKYGTDTALYTEANLGSTISSKVTNTASSTTIFDDDFIVAGKTTSPDTSSIKYYYILLEINDLTLPVTFNPTFSWTVECSDSVEEAETVTLTWDLPDWEPPSYLYYNTGNDDVLFNYLGGGVAYMGSFAGSETFNSGTTIKIVVVSYDQNIGLKLNDVFTQWDSVNTLSKKGLFEWNVTTPMNNSDFSQQKESTLSYHCKLDNELMNNSKYGLCGGPPVTYCFTYSFQIILDTSILVYAY